MIQREFNDRALLVLFGIASPARKMKLILDYEGSFVGRNAMISINRSARIFQK